MADLRLRRLRQRERLTRWTCWGSVRRKPWHEGRRSNNLFVTILENNFTKEAWFDGHTTCTALLYRYYFLLLLLPLILPLSYALVYHMHWNFVPMTAQHDIEYAARTGGVVIDMMVDNSIAFHSCAVPPNRATFGYSCRLSSISISAGYVCLLKEAADGTHRVIWNRRPSYEYTTVCSNVNYFKSCFKK